MRVRPVVMELMNDVRDRLRGHDVWIISAGVTFYALLAAIPLLVVALRITAALVGAARVDSWASAVGRALPQEQSPGPAIEAFVQRADAVSWRSVVVAVIPASVWGEGLCRGFARVSSASRRSSAIPAPGRWEGWRARIAVLPVLLFSPAGLLAILGVAPELAGLFGTGDSAGGGFGAGGYARTALAFYIALNVDWVVVSVVLVYAYRVLGPGRPGWWPLLAGSFATGAFISGFLQGFVIFLAVPVDLGAPFGGWQAAGAVVAVALWMWLLTALSIIGYALTMSLDERWPLNLPRATRT